MDKYRNRCKQEEVGSDQVKVRLFNMSPPRPDRNKCLSLAVNEVSQAAFGGRRVPLSDLRLYLRDWWSSSGAGRLGLAHTFQPRHFPQKKGPALLRLNVGTQINLAASWRVLRGDAATTMPSSGRFGD